ncbi:MAG: hypothetical protein ACHQ49_05600 [Elusimicrobiota bacterium]
MSAKGPVPNLVDAIAGEPVKGSWWSHPKGKLIFAALEGVKDSPDVLICRLIDNKLTLVHKRLWPALVRAAHRFPAGSLDQVRQEHTASGRHINHEIPFPKWVPAPTAKKAKILSAETAVRMLGLSGPPTPI